MIAPDIPTESLALIAWSRVWSPVVPVDWFEEAWRALQLPDDRALRDTEFCSLFHAGMPAPRVPLLLHAALGLSGDMVRTDWMRVMTHLGLAPGDDMLPADHLAVDCEIFAHAVARGEDLIVRELGTRYLLPWCEASAERLSGEDPRLLLIVERFRGLCEPKRDSQLKSETQYSRRVDGPSCASPRQKRAARSANAPSLRPRPS